MSLLSGVDCDQGSGVSDFIGNEHVYDDSDGHEFLEESSAIGLLNFSINTDILLIQLMVI